LMVAWSSTLSDVAASSLYGIRGDGTWQYGQCFFHKSRTKYGDQARALAL
jgi:hypothetical protein